MTDEEIKEIQLNWHKEYSQGCIYATFLAIKNPPESGVIRHCISDALSKDLVIKIDNLIQENIRNDDVQMLSIILPGITEESDLKKFIELLKTVPKNWIVDDEEIFNHIFKLVKVRIPLIEEKINGEQVYAWMLGFGKFEPFALTRQSPFTEIVVPVKSKEFLMKKFERISHYQQTTGTVHRGSNSFDAHLADIYILGVTNMERKDQAMWQGSSKLKKFRLGGSSDANAKAKITFCISI